MAPHKYLDVCRPLISALVAELCHFDQLVEVGIGNRPALAAALADRGVTVTATDIDVQHTPASVRFVRDDVTDPDLAVYSDADAVYALRCPPELQRPLADVAARAAIPAYFTTLGGDPAIVETVSRSVEGTTLHTVPRSTDTDGR